jgi:hypothetical protein
MTRSFQTMTRKSDKVESVVRSEEFQFTYEETVLPEKDPFEETFTRSRQQEQQKDDSHVSPVIDDQYLGDDEAGQELAEPGSAFGESTSDQQELDLLFESLIGMRSLFTEVPKTDLSHTYDLLHEAAGINGVDMSLTGIRTMMKKRKAAETTGRRYDEASAAGTGLDNRRGRAFIHKLNQELQSTTDVTNKHKQLFY